MKMRSKSDAKLNRATLEFITSGASKPSLAEGAQKAACRWC